MKFQGVWEAICLPKLHKCKTIITGMFGQKCKGENFLFSNSWLFVIALPFLLKNMMRI